MAQHEPLFSPRELVAALDDHLQDRGFDPAPTLLEALGPDDSPNPYATAGRWIRTRPSDDEQGRVHGNWEPTARHGGGDFFDVFLDYRASVTVAGARTVLNWRTTTAPLEAVVAAMLALIDVLDLDAPP